jgi:hypothetical protein
MTNARDCDYDTYPMCENQKWFFYLQDDKDIKQPYKYKCYQNSKAQILTQLLTQILAQTLSIIKIYTDNVTLNKLQYTFNLSEHEFIDDL